MDPATGASPLNPPRPVRTRGSSTTSSMLPVDRIRRPARRRVAANVTTPFSTVWATPILPAVSNASVDVRDFGAIDDDTTDNTLAFARAIAAAADRGGGQVNVPAGRWLVGPIELLDNIDLHVAAGAVVRFCDDPARYLPGVPMRYAGRHCLSHRPMIYARGRSHVAISGSGTLRGRGADWWSWAAGELRLAADLHARINAYVGGEADADAGPGDRSFRPPLVAFLNCRHVAVTGITIHGAGPACTLRLAECEHVLVRDVRLNVVDGPDNDGVVLDGCRDGRIERCEIDSAGHAIRLIGGHGTSAAGRLVVRDARLRSRHGDGLSLRGDGGLADVRIDDVRILEARHGVSLRASRGWGGVVERVCIENVTIDRASGIAVDASTEPAPFARAAASGAAPAFRHLVFRRIACAAAAQAVALLGQPEQPLEDVALHDVDLCADEGLTCASARGVSLRDVRITPTFGPDLSLRDVRDVQIEGIRHDRPDATFLDLRGRRTGGIRLRSEPGARVRPSIALGADVPRDAIEHV